MFVIWLLLLIIFGYVALRGYFKVLHESVRCAVVVTKVPKSNDVDVRSYKQAPGPLPWPVLGNLAMLGQYDVPFEGFTELSKKYGDVYSLTLGTTRCLIVNNLKLIREVLNENGKFFGGRPNFIRYNVLFGGDRNNCKFFNSFYSAYILVVCLLCDSVAKFHSSSEMFLYL